MKTWDARKEILVLVALEDGPKHGYEIASHISRASKDFFQLSYGSLYPILHKLEKQEMVLSKWEEGSSGKEKKVYRSTAKGKKQTKSEVDDFKSFIVAFSDLAGVRI